MNSSNRTLHYSLIALFFWLFNASTYAESVKTIDPAMLIALQEQVAALNARIAKLEASEAEQKQAIVSQPVQRHALAAPVVHTSQKQNSWVDRLSLKGDLRSRYENIDDERKDSERNRHRVRARAELSARIGERWKAGIGIASGGLDPRSSNQSLGEGNTTKNLGLDLAYVTYAVSESTRLSSGKFKNPFYRVGSYHMVWDSDFRPEGFSLKYQNNKLWANALINFLESDNGSGSKDAETSYGLQLGITQALNDHATLTAGASYFRFATKGSEPFFTTDATGNSTNASGEYLNNYKELELFAELSTTLGRLPLSAFLDYVNNQDVSKQDTAWAVGLKLGNAKDPRTWELAYSYQSVQADALYAALTDSDFANGRTDNSGHIIKAAFTPSKNTKLGFKFMLAEYGEQSLGENSDYNRLQVDLSVKF